MALDHYVSQTHLKQFFSPALGERMRGVKKSDLKSFPCHSADVCRIEEGSTNAFLLNERAVEKFLLEIEPHYNGALAKLRLKTVDQACIKVVVGFAAYVSCCAPAAMRVHSKPLKGQLEATSLILDRQGHFERAPERLGSKSMSDLIESREVGLNVDPKFPQALGIESINARMSLWGNSIWEILRNETNECPFFTSDYPVALEAKSSRLANWIIPLAPDLAIRIIPDISLSRTPLDLSFKNLRHSFRSPSRSEIVDINRLVVRCAEDMIFYRDDFPWVKDFIKKNRHFRVDAVVERRPTQSGFEVVSTQRVVPYQQVSKTT